WVECSDPDRIKAAEQMLLNAVTVADVEIGDFGVLEFASAAEAILEISARHPLRLEQARAIERKFAKTGTVDRLLHDQKITINHYCQVDYISPERAKAFLESTSGSSTDIVVDQIKCCTNRVKFDSGDEEEKYRVILADAYYNTLSQGHVSKEDLLKICFQYFIKNAMLKRLDSKFALKDVCKEFPQFEADIINMMISDEINNYAN
ncbi:hypothetical protein KJ762_11100, partial [bacterium]|nr:hypothetical protein [bacterium]